MAPTPELVVASSTQTQNTQKSNNDNENGYTNVAFECDQERSKQGDAFSDVKLSDLNINNEKNAVNCETTEITETANLDFDDVLPHLGEFGRYQQVLFLLMIPFAFFVAFIYFTQIFITLVPDSHWCRIPELENLTRNERLMLGIPNDGNNFTGDYSKCTMYDVNFTKLLENGIEIADPNWPTSKCKYGWEFDLDEIRYSTISTEMEWVCDDATLPSIAQSIFFCGAIVGGLLFGRIADHYGRVPALVISNLFGFVGGIATAFSNSFLMFAICRFVIGFSFDNCFTMVYILVLEYVGPKWRTFVANMSIAIFFTFAACILPWIAVWLKNWQMLTIVTSAPMIIAVFAPMFLPESARWLVSQGKIDKALTIMHKFEKINRVTVEPRIFTEFSQTCKRLAEEEKKNMNCSIIDLFKTRRLRNITVLFIVIWMAISVTFDGHVRNVGALGLDVFITFTVAAFTELPADVMLTYTLDIIGRRWYAFASLVLSGIFSLLATLFPIGLYSALLAIVGRFWINISYNIGLQYMAEVLPTVVRAQGVTFVHIMGYVASIVAPFVVYLSVISQSLPLIILGITGIFGGILSLFLPETMGKQLPQTIQEGEEFGRGQKFFDAPFLKKKKEDVSCDVTFKRSVPGSTGASLRASSRAEFRSSMLNRSSSLRISQNQHK